MYHIKQDKRSQTSAKLIVEGLYKCLSNKDFSLITISDIQRASLVGRSTFYRLFDNIVDVLEYECNNVFDDMLSSFNNNKNDDPFEFLFSYFFKYWMDHTELLNVLSNSGRINIMNKVFKNHSDQIRDILVPNISLSNKEVDYFISIVTNTILGIFEVWLSYGKKESINELMEVFKQSIFTLYNTIK